MYKRAAQGWLKHLDFILLDEVCLQAAFFLAYLIRQHTLFPYSNSLYQAIGILLFVYDLLVAVMTNSMHNVLKRGYYKEFTQTVKHCLMVFFLTILWMFTLRNSDTYSRTVVFLTLLFHIAIGYGARVLWKLFLRRFGAADSGKQAMLAVLDPEYADKMIERLTSNPVDGYHLAGLVLTDNPEGKTEVGGVPVVCAFDEAAKYICREWIDSVFISSRGSRPELAGRGGVCCLCPARRRTNRRVLRPRPPNVSLTAAWNSLIFSPGAPRNRCVAAIVCQTLA